MLTLLIALAAAAQTPQDRAASPIALPTDRQSWDRMTPAARNRYARITVQALRRSPAFARCEALDPDMLEIKISELAETGAPLMIGVAAAAYTMCEDGGR